MSLTLPFTHSASLEPGDVGAQRLLSLPARPGVLVIEGEEQSTLFVGAGANVREMARRRLLPSEQPSRRPDLRTIAVRALGVTVGSSLEADLIYLREVRKRLPLAHRAAASRWQGWFIHVDPMAEFPRWSKVALPGWKSSKDLPNVESGVLLGPFADKHALQRYTEALDDLFDLCRFHRILVLTPNATACAYKEMGKCPAPCDGSETMDAYRARLRDAIAFAQTPVDDALSHAEQRMNAAAESMDFEVAARLRDRVERTRRLVKPQLRWICALDRFRWLVVAPAERPGWARLLLILGGDASVVADVEASDGGLQVARELVQDAAARPHAFGFSDSEQETVGLVSSHLFRSGRRPSNVTFLSLGSGAPPEAAQLKKAVGRAARSDGAGEIDEQSLDPIGHDTSGQEPEAD